MMQSIIDAFATAAIISLGGLGLFLVIRSSGVLHFAHGAVFTVGAYSVFVFHKQFEFPFLASIVLGVSLSAILGATIELSVYRPLRERAASQLVLLAASLGLYVAIENAIALGFGPEVRSIRTWAIEEGWRFGEATIIPVHVAGILCAFFALSILSPMLRWTSLGLQTRGAWNDPGLAMCLGLPLEQLRMLSVLVGSALAGLAGILVAYDTDIYPSMGLNMLMLSLVAFVVGGSRFEGPALGALLVAMAQHLGVIWLPLRWQSLIVFTILLIYLVARPRGVHGLASSRADD